jgi:3-ketosteroid 9alpha-monooxygenase subunit A
MATTQDYRLGPQIFPRGWFVIGQSETLTTTPQAVRYFGNDMALYRGHSGRVVLLDAYCPHMGAHLAKNTTSWVVRGMQIEGDSIRCPFHAWRFGPDGVADDIPYSKGRIPKAACIRSWKVEERYGLVWVWHDPENGEPDYPLPAIGAWDDPSWVRWRIDDLGTLPCHPQEIVDNICDHAHLGPIHGSTVDYFENEFDGHIAIQRQGGGHRTLVHDGKPFSTDTWYTGPGILQCRMDGDFSTHMLICHTPVDDGVTHAWHALMVQSQAVPPGDADIAAARAFQDTSLAAFAQDFELWSTKRRALSILQVPADGPFDKARLWYRQFYNPRAEAKAIQERVNGVYHVPGMPAAPQAMAAE